MEVSGVERLNRSHRLRRQPSLISNDVAQLEKEQDMLQRENKRLRAVLERMIKESNSWSVDLHNHLNNTKDLIGDHIESNDNSIQPTSSVVPPLQRDLRTIASPERVDTFPVPKKPESEKSDEFTQFIVAPCTRSADMMEVKRQRSQSGSSVLTEATENKINQKRRVRTVGESFRRSSMNKLQMLQPESKPVKVKTEWTSTLQGMDAFVMIFDENQEVERYNLVSFVENFIRLLPEEKGAEYYQGRCTFTKHGEGSFHSKDKHEPLCGLWINNEIEESHHNFLLENDCDNHMMAYHPEMNIKVDLFAKLPEMVKQKIFQYFSISTLLGEISRVSREWNRLSSLQTVWKYHHTLVWGVEETEKTNEGKGDQLDWRQSFRNRFLLEENWRTGNCHATVLQGHSGWVTCVDMHHNRLVSSSYDGTVRVWNTQTGNELQTLGPLDSLSPVWCAQFKEVNIFAGYSDSLVRQWNTTTAQCIQEFPGHAGGVKCLQYSEPDSLLYTGSDDKSVKLFDIRTGECIRTIHCSDSVGTVHCHGHMLLTIIKRENNIFWMDLRTDQIVKELKGHEDAAYCFHYEPQSNALVSGGRDKKVLLWDMEKGEVKQTFEGHDNTIMNVQIVQNCLVSGSGDDTIKIWDITKGKCQATLLKHSATIMGMRADENKIVSGSADTNVVVWDFLRPIKHL